MESTFKRCIYHNLGQFWHDLKQPIENRRLLRSGLVSYSFRERLMLTVTEVNGCRYCSFFHAREALKAGLTEEEIRDYLQGELSNAPADELPALLYAQHWAESDGKADLDLQQILVKTYGRDRAEAIETILHMIRMGNLLGNLGDYILFRISFGRFGLPSNE